MSRKKVALVTGCSNGGIGYHFCTKLLDRDFIVYATARSLDAMTDLEHPNVKKAILDVTKNEHAEKVIESIMEDEGQIDMLINNAGTLAPGKFLLLRPLIDWTADEMKEVFEANVFSILRISRLVIPYMAKRRQGFIMNVGSIVGEVPTPWMGIYETTKAAVKVFTEVLEMECRPFNIDVMLLAPAGVKTNIYNNYQNFQFREGSLYAKFLYHVRKRLRGMGDKAMPASNFAESVISKAVQRNPPKYILLGAGSTLFRFLRSIPRQWRLNITWWTYSRPVNEENNTKRRFRYLVHPVLF
ncbi:NAD-P-binding protein [Hysterangium stoloniferum]|nr:NAD-P-binding protein [Hysterangium stoloniferum]